MTCITCDKPLDKEKAPLVFKSVPGKMGFCDTCRDGEQATRMLAGLVERKRADLW